MSLQVCSAPGALVGSGMGMSSVWLGWDIAGPPQTSCWVMVLCRSVSRGGCGVSFSGDIPDPPGRGAVQPALGDPASAGGLGWVTHRGPCQPLLFCDSVILSQMFS